MTVFYHVLHNVTGHRRDKLSLYISVFVRLMITTFWELAYQFLHLLTYRFGGQDCKTIPIMQFVIFSSLAGRLVWIMQVHFRRITLPAITRVLQTFLWQWNLISHWNSTVVPSLAPSLAIPFHVPL